LWPWHNELSAQFVSRADYLTDVAGDMIPVDRRYDNQELAVGEWHRCPNCAYPLSLPQANGSGVSSEVVEALLGEIRRLRESVALLRGTSHPGARLGGGRRDVYTSRGAA
jgi:hypothetical protein